MALLLYLLGLEQAHISPLSTPSPPCSAGTYFNFRSYFRWTRPTQPWLQLSKISWPPDNVTEGSHFHSDGPQDWFAPGVFLFSRCPCSESYLMLIWERPWSWDGLWSMQLQIISGVLVCCKVSALANGVITHRPNEQERSVASQSAVLYSSLNSDLLSIA